MPKTKISLLAAILTATSTAILFTCEKIPDYCGTGEIYDPSCEFCFGSRAYPRCSGGAEYNPLTGGCDKNNVVGTRCSDGSVVPSGTPCGGYMLALAAMPETGGQIKRADTTKHIYEAKEDVTLIASPDSGYAFAGWAGTQPYKKLAVGAAETGTFKMNSSNSKVTVVAMFKPTGKGKLITEAFPKDGGTVTRNPDKETYSDEMVTVTAAYKSGYTFIGWSGADTSQNATTTVFVDESKTLVAMFARVVHTLKANVNPSDGGAVYINGSALSSQKVGDEVGILAVENEGYRFKEWSGSAEFGDKRSISTTVKLSADATVTANFERGSGIGSGAPQAVTCTLTVKRDPSEGGTVSLNPDGRVYNMGMSVTVTAKPAGEYRFIGWSDGSKNISNDSDLTITMDKSKTLIAKFQARPKAGQFIIKIDPNNGTQTSETTTDTNGMLAILPSAPSRSGYTFDGWYTTLSTDGEKVTAGYKFAGDAVIYARWTEVSSGGGGTYESVTIGGKKWMKKNLNIETDDSWCYLNSADSCAKYGRLYTWSAAKAACQSIGRRLPTRKEWDDLSDLAGTGQKVVDNIIGSDTVYYWPGAGTKLKSTTGWNNNGNGTDDFGFSALPGGYRNDFPAGSFINAGIDGNWWTATEYGSGYAYIRGMYYGTDHVYGVSVDKSNGQSVRCVEGN